MHFRPATAQPIIGLATRSRFRLRVAVLSLFIATLSACGIPMGGGDSSHLQGLIVDQQLNEISGMVASKKFKDIYWVLNDGGNTANLYAIDEYGSRVATLNVDGVRNTDWEDLSLYEKDGKPYLVVADIGDNGGLRKTLQLHLFEEPDALTNSRIEPTRSIAFKYPDGPHDAEALAIDSANDQAIIITKKRKPPLTFAVPLTAPHEKLVTATALGEALHIPVASPEELKSRPKLAPYDHQVTAASIAPDRKSIAVMTYRYLLIYKRGGKESWGDALESKPTVRVLPIIPQAEAMSFTTDGGSVMATGEFSVAPMFRIPVAQ